MSIRDGSGDQPAEPAQQVTCPPIARSEGDLVGCGTTFTAAPDEEGFFDCPNCGLFFKPEPAEPRGMTIDLTPPGCRTPEDNARVNAAVQAFENSHAEVANLATQYFEHYGMVTDPDAFEECEELREAINRRRAAQDEFLRAIAGHPPAK